MAVSRAPEEHGAGPLTQNVVNINFT
jgi:hypothetical protein